MVPLVSSKALAPVRILPIAGFFRGGLDPPPGKRIIKPSDKDTRDGQGGVRLVRKLRKEDVPEKSYRDSAQSRGKLPGKAAQVSGRGGCRD